MPRKSCDTSFEKRQLVIYNYAKGLSGYKVAERLNMKLCTIYKILRGYKNEDRINRTPRSGRPEKLSLQDKQILLRQMQREPTVSAEELSRNFTQLHGKKISRQTLRNVFKSSGFNSRSARNKPYISAITVSYTHLTLPTIYSV